MVPNRSDLVGRTTGNEGRVEAGSGQATSSRQQVTIWQSKSRYLRSFPPNVTQLQRATFYCSRHPRRATPRCSSRPCCASLAGDDGSGNLALRTPNPVRRTVCGALVSLLSLRYLLQRSCSHVGVGSTTLRLVAIAQAQGSSGTRSANPLSPAGTS